MHGVCVVIAVVTVCWFGASGTAATDAVLDEENLIITTDKGRVQGLARVLADGRKYDSWLGIPFGDPLDGKKRFTRPKSATSWAGVHSAKEFRPYCKQLASTFYPIIGLNSKDSENCLYLNVYRPAGLAHDAKLPVMFWVFGGAFYIGVADMYPGEELTVNGQVIVVTINYRVGTLAFMSMGNSASQGNFGLWDQGLALQWTHDNIAAFGGDAKRITVFGQSAGGASVSHLMYSPHTRHLFQRAIAMSGSSSSYFGYTTQQRSSAKNLGRMMVCARLSDKSMVECMRRRTPRQLDLGGLAAPLSLGLGRIPNWLPVIDNEYVAQDPRTAMEHGVGGNHDLITGYTKHDGAFIIYMNPLGLPTGDLTNIASTRIMLQAALKFMMSPYGNARELVKAVNKQYPGIESNSMETRTKAAVQALTDFVFASQAYQEAELHSQHASTIGRRTYMYQFRYRQSFLKYEPWVTGSHVDDMYSVFGEVFLDKIRKIFLRGDFNDEDREVSLSIQHYYANFAYSGNPNVGPHKVAAHWPQYDSESQRTMALDLHPQTINHTEEQLSNYQFWTQQFVILAKPRKAETYSDEEYLSVGSVVRKIEAALEEARLSLEQLKEDDVPNMEGYVKFVNKILSLWDDLHPLEDE